MRDLDANTITVLLAYKSPRSFTITSIEYSNSKETGSYRIQNPRNTLLLKIFSGNYWDIKRLNTQRNVFWLNVQIVFCESGFGGVSILLADRWTEKNVALLCSSYRIHLPKLIIRKVVSVFCAMYAPKKNYPKLTRSVFITSCNTLLPRYQPLKALIQFVTGIITLADVLSNVDCGNGFSSPRFLQLPATSQRPSSMKRSARWNMAKFLVHIAI